MLQLQEEAHQGKHELPSLKRATKYLRIKILTRLIVPGDSPCLRSLREDRLEVRIPLHASDHPPGMNTLDGLQSQDAHIPYRTWFKKLIIFIATASPSDSSFQFTRHAILPALPHPVLPPPPAKAGGDLDP